MFLAKQNIVLKPRNEHDLKFRRTMEISMGWKIGKQPKSIFGSSLEPTNAVSLQALWGHDSKSPTFVSASLGPSQFTPFPSFPSESSQAIEKLFEGVSTKSALFEKNPDQPTQPQTVSLFDKVSRTPGEIDPSMGLFSK